MLLDLHIATQHMSIKDNCYFFIPMNQVQQNAEVQRIVTTAQQTAASLDAIHKLAEKCVYHPPHSHSDLVASLRKID